MNTPHCFRPTHAGLLALKTVRTVTFALTLMSTPLLAFGQMDDFNDGNDAGWAHFDPLGAVAALFGQGAKASFSFPGGAYRIQAQPFTAAGDVGPARAASFRTNVYADFYVTVDVVNWNTNLNQAFGLLGRITLIDPMIPMLPTGAQGPGAVNGYAMNYLNVDHMLQINALTAEDPTTIGEVSVTLTPGQPYRLVFQATGSNLEGRAYALSNLSTPLATVTAVNAAHSSGINGLFIYNNQNNTPPADVTFDNFSASPDLPITLTLSQLPGIPDELYLTWPASPSGYTLQCTTNLTPPRLWTSITNDVIDFGTFFQKLEGVGAGNKFYRLSKTLP